MKIIQNKFIPFDNYTAINLFGIVFAKKPLDEISINHEAIHTAQMKEMLYIFFYLWYAIEYLFIHFANLSKSQNKKYHQISFEQEAHYYDTNLAYLNWRKPYSWLEFFKIKIK